MYIFLVCVCLPTVGSLGSTVCWRCAFGTFGRFLVCVPCARVCVCVWQACTLSSYAFLLSGVKKSEMNERKY